MGKVRVLFGFGALTFPLLKNKIFNNSANSGELTYSNFRKNSAGFRRTYRRTKADVFYSA